MSNTGKLIMTCRDATYFHEIKKEGRLGFKGRFGLWLHLLFCGICRLFVKQVEEVERVCGKAAATQNVQMPDAAKDRIQQQLQNEIR